MNPAMQIKSAEFLTSATGVRDCPPDDVPECAMIGRSNVGRMFPPNEDFFLRNPL